MKKYFFILHLLALLLGLNINSQNLYIASGGSIEASAGAKISVESDMTVDPSGSFILKNATLKVAGISSGSITYIKTLSNSLWTPVVSPVENQNIKEFAIETPLDSGQNDNSSNKGLVRYQNATNSYEIYQDGSNAWGNFPIGEAYLVKLRNITESDDNSIFYNLSFTGSISNTDLVFTPKNSTVVWEGENKTNRLLFIGNPFTSYLNLNNPDNSILKNNENNVEDITAYLWDSSQHKFSAANLISEEKIIDPTVGFFVRTTDDFIFHKNLTSHQKYSKNSFEKNTENKQNICLKIINNTSGSYKKAHIFYTNRATTGFDNGYDSKSFYSGMNYFDIYTRLVSDGLDDDYEVQSLPQSAYEKMIIPIGINAKAGTNITLSASIINLPSEISVYLEDKETNTFTLLDQNSTVTTTLLSDLNGVGRFYLYTTGQVLDLTDVPVNNNNIIIYTSSRDNLRVVGVQNEQVTIRIYNILGKKIIDTYFKGNGLNNIALPPDLTSGIYIVQLITSKWKFNKKISIE